MSIDAAIAKELSAVVRRTTGRSTATVDKDVPAVVPNGKGTMVDELNAIVKRQTGRNPFAEEETRNKAYADARHNYIYSDMDRSAFEYKTLEEYDTEIAKLTQQYGSIPKMNTINPDVAPSVALAFSQQDTPEGKSIKARIDALTAQRNLLERALRVEDTYGGYRSAADWAVYSTEQDTPYARNLGTRYNLVNLGAESIGDLSDVEQAYKIKYGVDPQDDYVLHESLRANRDYGYGYMTDEERATFNYLVNTGKWEQAGAYLEDMETILSKRRANANEWDEMVDYQDDSFLEKVGKNAATLITSPVGAISGTLDDLAHLAFGQDINPYSAAHDMTAYTDIIRGSTAQEIHESVLSSTGSEAVAKLASVGYQAGMSSLDSLVGATTLGTAGYLVVAGANSFTHKAKELYESGADGWQIFAGSVASGVLEMAMEKLPLDELGKMAKQGVTLKGFLKNGLKQSGIEATEEVLTELSNIVSDAIIQGGNSDLSRSVVAYEQDGLSHEEAYKKALGDKAADVMWAGIGGLASGGPSATFFSGIGVVRQYQAVTNAGRRLMQNPAAVQKMVDEAATLPRVTKAYSLAQQLKSGKQTPHKVGALVEAIQSPETQKAVSLAQQTVQSAAQFDVDEQVVDTVANAAAATGRPIVFGVTPQENGKETAGTYDPSTGVVTISPYANGEQVGEFIVKHELTHSIQNTKQWWQLASIVEDKLGEDGWSTAVADTMTARGLDRQQAEREVVADWVGHNLYTAGFVSAIVKGDTAMGNAFIRTIDRLRLVLGNKKSRAKTDLAVLERLFARALHEGQSLYSGDEEYMIVALDDGKIYVQAERRVLTGTDKVSWKRQIDAFFDKVLLRNGNLIVDSVEGDTLTITKEETVWKGKDEYESDSGHRRILRKNEYFVKLQALSHIDELSEASVARKNSDGSHKVVEDKKNHPFAKDGFEYRTVYFRDVDDKYYRIVLSVGLADGISTVYNVGKIEETDAPEGSVISAIGSKAQGATVSNTKIPQNVSGVNTQSMQNGQNNSQNAVVDPSWLRSNVAEDGAAATSHPPVSQSTAQEVEWFDEGGNAAQNTADASEMLERATDVNGVIEALGDEEAYRRLNMAAQIDRPIGKVELDGLQMTADEYSRRVYESLPSDVEALRALYEQTTESMRRALTEAATVGESESPTLLKLNMQLFAQKAKMDYLLDSGEEGDKARQFYEKRLQGKDANHSEELLELLKGHDETYNPIANEKTLNTAKDKLRNAKYQHDLHRRVMRNNPRDMFTAVDAAATQVMINDAINDGDMQLAMDLIIGLSRKGTELGRAVQVLSMQRRLTPEGTLRAASRMLRKEADHVIGEGSDAALDVVAEELSDTITAAEETARRHTPKKATAQTEGASAETEDTAEPVGTPPPRMTETAPTSETVPQEDLSRGKLRDALVDDLAATKGNYLSKEEIGKLVDKVINESTNIPEQLRRFVTKKLGTGALAERIYEVYKKGHLNDTALRRAMEDALGLPTLSEAEIARVVELATEINGLDEDPVKQAEVMDTLYDMLGEKLHVSKLEQLQSWRKFAMLANPKTHIRNIVSNAAYLGIRKTDNAVAQALETWLLKDPKKAVSAMGWSHTPEGQSLMPLLRKEAVEAVLAMQHRGKKYETGSGVLDSHKKPFGKYEVLNKTNRVNSEWLEREDVWFFKPAFIDALGQVMVARGMTEVTPEVRNIAMARAEEATFRADNAISDVLKSLKRFQRSDKTGLKLFGHAVDVVIPFAKTPANIAVQSFYHSPLGLVKGAFELYNAIKGKGSVEAAQAINTIAKGVTGTALLGIGVLLASLGMFNTGFGKTEKERAADELAGLQENALVFGDVSISLDWLQPAASPIVVGASMAQRLKEEGLSLSTVFGALMDGTDSLFELTMLQSLYDVLGGYDAGATASAGSVVENIVSQSVPTLVGQTARAIDPVQRKTKGDNAFETVVNQVIAKIPGLTYLLEPELDVWGDEVYRTGKASGGSAVLNILQQFGLPSNIKIATGAGDAVSDEILRLYGAGASGAIPTAISRDDAANYGLDYTETNRALGKVNRSAVAQFINDEWPYAVVVDENGRKRKVTKYYSEMTDDERRKVLSRIYTKSKKQFADPEEASEDDYYAKLMEELK